PHRFRDPDHAIIVAEYEIAGLDLHAAALNGYVDVGHEAAPPRIQRHDAARKRGKAHGDDPLDVSDDGVDDRPGRTAHLRRGREQLTPGGHRPRMVGAVDRDVTGPQRIDRSDLVYVRVRFHGLVGRHPEQRPRSAHHDEVRMQWPDVMTHRLVPKAEAVQCVGDYGRVELLANP